MTSPKAPNLEDLPRMSAEERAARRLTPPPGEDFWVFGYGSLMWHPGFAHVEVRIARVRGLHRSFCVYSHRYRGTPEAPGLVLGLDRGGECEGMVFRVPAAEGAAVLDYLDEREMVTGVYHPTWCAAETDSGPVTAMAYVADRDHRQYAGGLDHDAMVALILQGRGANGLCLEYLENTVHHLHALGIRDAALERLLEEAERLRAARSREGKDPS